MLRRIGLKIKLSTEERVVVEKISSFAIFLCACSYAIEFFCGAIEILEYYQVAWLMSLFWTGIELAYQSGKKETKARLYSVILFSYAMVFLGIMFGKISFAEFSSVGLLFVSGFIMSKMAVYFEKR